MRKPPVRFAVLGAVAIALAACGGGGPAASVIPTVPPVPTTPPIGVPTTPPVINPDADLESLFPDTVGGHAIEVESAQGQSVYALFQGTDTSTFNQFLSDIGTTIDQVSGAISFGLWPGPTEGEFTGLTILAFRAANVPAEQTLARFALLVAEDVDNAELGTATIAGKGVTTIVNPEDADENLYLYPTGNVVFMVGGTPAYVEEALSKLP